MPPLVTAFPTHASGVNSSYQRCDTGVGLDSAAAGQAVLATSKSVNSEITVEIFPHCLLIALACTCTMLVT